MPIAAAAAESSSVRTAYLTSQHETIAGFHQNGILNDCRIRIETTDNQVEDFYAHRIILAAASPFFKAAFVRKQKAIYTFDIRKYID